MKVNDSGRFQGKNGAAFVFLIREYYLRKRGSLFFGVARRFYGMSLKNCRIYEFLIQRENLIRKSSCVRGNSVRRV